MLAVTSFHPQKQPYGLRCLESLVKHFPGRIVAYIEGDLEMEGVEVKDFFSIPGVSEYLQAIKRVSGSNGGSPYDYRYDTDKFCRKVFAQDQAFDLDELVFWFDADMVVFKDFPEEFLEGLVKGVPFAYFGRKNYTETGFLGFNTKHKMFPAFRGSYLSCFTSGRIFQQHEWHDCIAFDLARKGIQGNNLSPKGETMGHVLLKSALAQYCDHTKGKRKDLGYSPGHPVTDPSARPHNRV